MNSNKLYHSLLALAALTIVITGVKAASDVINLMLLSVFITILCVPVQGLFKRWNMPVYLSIPLLLLGFAGVQILFVTIVSTSVNQLTDNAAFYQERLMLYLNGGVGVLQNLGMEITTAELNAIFDPNQIFKWASMGFREISQLMSDSFLILLAVIFMLLEAVHFREKAVKAFDGADHPAIRTCEGIIKKIHAYMLIKTMMSFGTGVFITLWLWAVGVDFPYLWGLLAFALNFIPNIGSFLAAIPAILLALVQLGPLSALLSGIGFLVVNVVIGNIIEPVLMGNRLGVSTLVVFLSLVLWGWLLGPIGMLLSIPLTMTIKLAMEEGDSTRPFARMLS